MTAAALSGRHLPELLLQTDVAREEPEVARARREVAKALVFWGLTDLVDAVQLLTSELVTNSVLHGAGDSVTVTLRCAEDELTISVTDGAPDDLPDPREPGETTENGRGMLLVEHLSKRWGVTVDPGADTKDTWACLPVPGSCA